MKLNKTQIKFINYLIVLFVLILYLTIFVFTTWSLWHSPWRVGTPYRVIITYVTLIVIVIYKVIKFFRKQEKWKENGNQQNFKDTDV